jgi:endoglucanase
MPLNNTLKYLLAPLFLFLFSKNSFSQNNPFNIGIVLCGAEFGEKNLPGQLNTDYIYPTKDEINYFALKGFKSITLPFKWERVQRSIGSPLDSLELQNMRQFVRTCDSAHIKVILTLQNFAVYYSNANNYLIGSHNLSYDSYGDFWKKMATAFADCPNIYGYDIMNEPRNIFSRHWRKAAQAAINGIREVDKTCNIIVDGENSSFSADWKFDNNSLKRLKDPSNKIIYDAHCYFDYNHSGRYDGLQEGSIKDDVGVERIKPFVKWLKRHHKNGMIGEFGVPTDASWLRAMDNFIKYAIEKGIQVNYWAAGPWWNDYLLSIEPANGIDKPQMKIIEKYLSGGDKK